MIETLSVSVTKQGLKDITAQVAELVGRQAGLSSGLCTLFIQHTSASLLIQENYDPSAKHDLETWLNRLVPENDPLYTHTLETWQGIFLWEHRHYRGQRKVIMHLSD